MLPDGCTTNYLVLTRLVSKPSHNKELTSNSQVIKRNISIARQDNNMGYARQDNNMGYTRQDNNIGYPMPYPK